MIFHIFYLNCNIFQIRSQNHWHNVHMVVLYKLSLAQLDYIWVLANMRVTLDHNKTLKGNPYLLCSLRKCLLLYYIFFLEDSHCSPCILSQLALMADPLKMIDPLKTAVGRNQKRKPDLGYSRYLLCMMVDLLKLSDKSPSHKIQLVDNQSVKNKISVVGMKLKESILK